MNKLSHPRVCSSFCSHHKFDSQLEVLFQLSELPFLLLLLRLGLVNRKLLLLLILLRDTLGHWTRRTRSGGHGNTEKLGQVDKN